MMFRLGHLFRRISPLFCLLMLQISAPMHVSGSEPASPLISDADWERSEPQSAVPQDSSISESAARMAVGLMVVLAIIVATAWWLRKRQQQHGSHQVGDDRLKLTASLQLGMRRQVNLIEVDGQWVLIGQSERGFVALGQGNFAQGNFAQGNQGNLHTSSPK